LSCHYPMDAAAYEAFNQTVGIAGSVPRSARAFAGAIGCPMEVRTAPADYRRDRAA
jgi:hypothetical protein